MEAPSTNSASTISGGGGGAWGGVKDPSTISAPNFEVKRWNVVTQWSRGGRDALEDCMICKNSLSEPSIEYQANPSTANENGLQISFGTCQHVFHLDCIQRFLKSRSACPHHNCSMTWEHSKIEKIPGHGAFSDIESPVIKKI